MRQSAARMAESCDSLLSKASVLNDLGQENVQKMEDLRSRLEEAGAA
jgi:hypothetical protein